MFKCPSSPYADTHVAAGTVQKLRALNHTVGLGKTGLSGGQAFLSFSCNMQGQQVCMQRSSRPSASAVDATKVYGSGFVKQLIDSAKTLAFRLWGEKSSLCRQSSAACAHSH